MTKLNHFNAQGEAHMVNIGSKAHTQRQAISEGSIIMQQRTLDNILSGSHKKGDVLGIARIAGIMAAKKTAELIPLCHPIPITHINIELTPSSDKIGIYCRCTLASYGQTGIEMEALTATQICLLTIYDMCKAIDKGMRMTDIQLLEKSGGKSGHWINTDNK